MAYPASTSFARCQAAVGLDTESARAISAAVQQGCHARYSNTRLRFSFMSALLAAACDSDSYASDTTALSAAPSFRSSLKAVLLEDQGEDLERLHVAPGLGPDRLDRAHQVGQGTGVELPLGREGVDDTPDLLLELRTVRCAFGLRLPAAHEQSGAAHDPVRMP